MEIDRPTAGSPRDLNALIAAAFNAGDREAFVALHEAGATVVVPPDKRHVTGVEAIREAVEPTFALGPEMASEVVETVETDGLALTHARWRMVASVDGRPVEMSGRGTIVSRRQPDGTWRVVLDNPLSPE